MLQQIRQQIIEMLWQAYCTSTHVVEQIISNFPKNDRNKIILDHVALIDLPGACTGRSTLQALFELIGYEKRGEGYLPDKQNYFLWMAEENADQKEALTVLPQVVVADFNLAAMPPTIQKIVQRYASQATARPLQTIRALIDRAKTGDPRALPLIQQQFKMQLLERKWPLPTLEEWQQVEAFNPLLAWVMVFGPRPNHFALAIHHCSHFTSLEHFHDFLEHQLKIALSEEGGKIKGENQGGILQSSTQGAAVQIALRNGQSTLTANFVEFVWRRKNTALPRLWRDYFTGFIAAQANHVIETLYAHPSIAMERQCQTRT